ncbi:MAG: IS66 family insertion sequence element accessory protein TnpB [Deltaproteobacteria bacterium]|nr:IS66 family insertion sequence element accessory protein TnpB [Deltaproteobacteria bacterium]
MRDALGGDPRAGHVFLFHNKRTTHVKLLWHDGRSYRISKLSERDAFCVKHATPLVDTTTRSASYDR